MSDPRPPPPRRPPDSPLIHTAGNSSSSAHSAHASSQPSPSAPTTTSQASASGTTSLPTSFLTIYAGLGAVLLTGGVLFGFQLGSRKAAQLEQDYPLDTSKHERRPPPLSPSQRRAASRQAFAALGIGTVLCGLFGVALTAFISRHLEVKDTREFADKMPGIVQATHNRWIGALVSSITQSAT